MSPETRAPSRSQNDRAGCFACELIEHPERVPGGLIATLGGWVVEPCVGPLGVGTVIVKPSRHVTSLADLDPTETDQMGPLLINVARAVTAARAEAGDTPEQVYCCLWSHADRRPGHIHFVVQPVSAALMAHYDAYGPALQLRMFEANEPMDPTLVAEAAARIRAHLTGVSSKLPTSDMQLR
jgi:hypothetical protein